MSVVIDLEFHRTTLRVVDELLERRGLGYFLQKEKAFPYKLCERRLALVLRIASRRVGGRPGAATRQVSKRALRRRLIALVAEAMVHVGY